MRVLLDNFHLMLLQKLNIIGKGLQKYLKLMSGRAMKQGKLSKLFLNRNKNLLSFANYIFIRVNCIYHNTSLNTLYFNISFSHQPDNFK